MLSQNKIKSEVWKVFGKDASKVEVGYEPTFDGVIIRVTKITDGNVSRATGRLSSLEMLESVYPLATLQSYIINMYQQFKQELANKEAEKNGNLCNSQRQISSQGGTDGG
jgi:hypothetical protein